MTFDKLFYMKINIKINIDRYNKNSSVINLQPEIITTILCEKQYCLKSIMLNQQVLDDSP